MCHGAVSIHHIDVTLARTRLLADGLVGHHHAVRGAEVQRHAGKHAGANALVGVVDGHLHGECAGVRIHGRIHDRNLARESLAGIGVERNVADGHAHLHVAHEALAHVQHQLHGVDLLHHEHGLLAVVEVAVVIVAGSHHAVDGAHQACILCQVLVGAALLVHTGLLRIPGALRDAAHLVKLVVAVELQLGIVKLDLGLSQAVVVKHHEGLPLHHAIAHLNVDATDAHGSLWGNVVHHVSLDGCREFLDLIDVARLHGLHFHVHSFKRLICPEGGLCLFLLHARGGAQHQHGNRSHHCNFLHISIITY